MIWRALTSRYLAALVIGGGFAGPAMAQDDGAGAGDAAYAASGAISISGQIIDEDNGCHVLQSAAGQTRIGIAGWPGDRPIFGVGDEVTEIGSLTRDFLSDRMLDIAAVYVADRRAYFVMGQKEPAATLVIPSLPRVADGGPALVTGTILELAANGFVLEASDAELPVETDLLKYKRYDDIGAQRLRVGDLVLVGGSLERDAEFRPTRRAETVTSIHIVHAGV